MEYPAASFFFLKWIKIFKEYTVCEQFITKYEGSSFKCCNENFILQVISSL